MIRIMGTLSALLHASIFGTLLGVRLTMDFAQWVKDGQEPFMVACTAVGALLCYCLAYRAHRSREILKEMYGE